MPYQPRPMELICRETITGLWDDIQGYTHPINDNRLAAWEMALQRAKDMVLAISDVCEDINKRPMVSSGNDALRAIATLNPAEEAAFDELEAQAIERAHPTTFNMPDFAATVCGMKKPA